MFYRPEIVGRKFWVGEKGVKYLGGDINKYFEREDYLYY
jgi:hypothetical protein